jgi:uncharacterized membrane protein YfcA
MRWVKQFGHFWYDFIVGDDWRIAIGVVVALGIVYVAAHHGFDWWWLLPLAVGGLLAASVSRVRRKRVS